MVDRDLDEILLMRAKPAAPNDLASRIITVSRGVKQVKPDAPARGGLFSFLDALFMPSYALRPALAMALVLFVGFTLGAYSGAEAMLVGNSVTAEEIADFMDIEDRFVASEFLGGS